MILRVYRDVAAFLVIPIFVLTTIIWAFGIGFAEFECFVREYSGTIISLGTLCLVSALAIFAAHLASRSAEITARNNRRIEAELKVAEFRQAWISEMRDDIAELIGLSFHPKDEDSVAKAYQLSMKIEMRLNPHEVLATSVSKCLSALAGGRTDTKDFHSALSSLVLVSREYLKNEWTRLKSDIEHAQLLEASSES